MGTELDDDLPGVTRLVLVRHAEGKVNVDGILGGLSGCTGLIELGRHHAKLLSDRWASTGFCPDALVTSPVRRARETRRWFQEVRLRFANKTVVAVTHAGFIVASMLEFLALKPLTERGALDPRFMSITIWQSDSARWVLQCFNDTAHLEHRIVASTDLLTS